MVDTRSQEAEGAAYTVPVVGGTRLALDQPRGAWVATLALSCVTVLCLASSIPFRRVVPVGDDTTAPAGAR